MYYIIYSYVFPISKMTHTYRYEKMISGMYLGELTRLALLKRTLHKNCIFARTVPDMLHKKDSLDGATVSDCIK